jgi:RecB family exonuclease
MPLSYTALKTFRDCHFRYHLRYDRGLPSRPRPAAQSSRALHGALHLFHQGLKQGQAGENTLFPPAAMSLDTLLAHFKGYYDNPTRPLTESQYKEGRTLLTRYWEAYRGQFPMPYLLEEAFKLHVGSFLLAGRFDRVDETPEGFEIVDTSCHIAVRFRPIRYSLMCTVSAFARRRGRRRRSCLSTICGWERRRA